jgi:DNA-binding transcriptional MerR regulator
VEGLHSTQIMEYVEKRLLKIGEVARLTDFPVKTLRYYEERGLVEPAERTEAGYRLYGMAKL